MAVEGVDDAENESGLGLCAEGEAPQVDEEGESAFEGEEDEGQEVWVQMTAERGGGEELQAPGLPFAWPVVPVCPGCGPAAILLGPQGRRGLGTRRVSPAQCVVATFAELGFDPGVRRLGARRVLGVVDVVDGPPPGWGPRGARVAVRGTFRARSVDFP